MSTSLFRLRIAAYLIATAFWNHGLVLFVIMECIKLPLRVGWAEGMSVHRTDIHKKHYIKILIKRTKQNKTKQNTRKHIKIKILPAYCTAQKRSVWHYMIM